ncbi:hypothetical protein G7B40_040005 [Aetokthonos hydrillicola Thurmond2011]|uniref:Uncharacterized protein n=1 Tax=Aetokthonos hydrillicola Thurmond2011 TaxID=2712845 RepID=A0AAP5IIL7_9CYAN|nr:hypothetical protein [Aetokthonos hydrillicola CCALA 1050]MDR9900675.1 hypothetical protein [Aetokthonos hydrillicola Thurmond2011]
MPDARITTQGGHGTPFSAAYTTPYRAKAVVAAETTFVPAKVTPSKNTVPAVVFGD